LSAFSDPGKEEDSQASVQKDAGRRALEEFLGDDFDLSQIQSDSASDEGLITEELLREVEENRPSNFRVISDVMGFNLFTYVLAALIVVSAGANVVLGNGWLSDALYGPPPAPIPKERHLDLPEGYTFKAPKTTEEMLRGIPAEDLERIIRGEDPHSGK